LQRDDSQVLRAGAMEDHLKASLLLRMTRSKWHVEQTDNLRQQWPGPSMVNQYQVELPIWHCSGRSL